MVLKIRNIYFYITFHLISFRHLMERKYKIIKSIYAIIICHF